MLLASRATQQKISQQPGNDGPTQEGLSPQIVIIIGVLFGIPALIIALCILRSICKMCGTKDGEAVGDNKTTESGRPRGRVVPLERALVSMTATERRDASCDVRG